MTDLYDELQEKTGDKIGSTVRTLGGDLYDELAIREGKPQNLRREFSDLEATESRRAMLEELNNELSLLEKFAIGLGRGTMTLARGVGLAEPEDPTTTRAFQHMARGKDTPTVIPTPWGGGVTMNLSPDRIAAEGGQVLAESAPFLPLGIGTAAIQNTFARVLANVGLGGLEGGIIARGTGGDGKQGAVLGAGITAIMEAVNPLLGRMVSALYNRAGRLRPRTPPITPEGVPTEEFQRVLDETGTDFNQMVRDAFTTIKDPELNPEMAARRARFESERIPYTRGDITQEFDQQVVESRLAETTASGAADEMRTLRLDQSQAFEQRINEMVERFGVPGQAGENIKSALSSRKQLLRNEKNALYRQVEESAPDLVNAPLFTDDILMAIPDSRKMARWRRAHPAEMREFDDLMVEFGISDDPAAIKAFTDRGGEIVPLNLGNFEDFRQELNRITRADTTGTVSLATGPVKQALDSEVMMLDQLVRDEGMVDKSVLKLLKDARERVRTLKTEFSDQAIAGRLTNTKRDGFTPVIEASKAVDTVLRPGAPIEYLQRTMESLAKQGDKGLQAIRDMQAAVLLDSLNYALKAPSRKIGGQQVMSGTMFVKALDRYGDDKLRLLFRGNEEGYSQLMNMRKIAMDMEATAAARPKGSASANLDIVSRMVEAAGRWSGLTSYLMPLIRRGYQASAQEAAIRSARDVNQRVAPVVIEFDNQWPQLAGFLGVAALVNGEKDMTDE